MIQTDDGTNSTFYAYNRQGNVCATFGTDGSILAEPREDAWGVGLDPPYRLRMNSPTSRKMIVMARLTMRVLRKKAWIVRMKATTIKMYLI